MKAVNLLRIHYAYSNLNIIFESIVQATNILK